MSTKTPSQSANVFLHRKSVFLEEEEEKKKKRKKKVKRRLTTPLHVKDPCERRPVTVDSTGQAAYQRACHKFGAIPSTRFIRRLANGAELNMANYCLTEEDIMSLSIPIRINSQCRKLNLSGNFLSEKSLLHLTTMLEENDTINALDLSQTQISNFGAELLAKLFVSNSTIKTLNLSGNDFTDDDGMLLAHALLQNRTLTEVDLSHNSMADKFAATLRKTLSEGTNLVSLDISWNHLRADAVCNVAAGLQESIGLRRFNMSWNGAEDIGARAIATALEGNASLHVLELNCNRISGLGYLSLIGALSFNYTLQELHIAKNSITEDLALSGLVAMEAMEQLHLKVLDLSENIYSPEFEVQVEATRTAHMPAESSTGSSASTRTPKSMNEDAELVIKWGYTDSYGKRKLAKYDALTEAFQFLQLYISEHNINLVELFAKFDVDGSMSITYDEFREGLKEAKIPLTDLQVDELISFLDQDGDGEIDFSEMVIGTEEHEKQKQK